MLKRKFILSTMGSQWRFSEEWDEIRSVFLNNHFDYIVKSRMERVPEVYQKPRKEAIFGV